METGGFGIDQIFKIILTFLTVSGGAAWAASFLTNKRGENKALDFILDIIELVGGNINKASNDKTK